VLDLFIESVDLLYNWAGLQMGLIQFIELIY